MNVFIDVSIAFSVKYRNATFDSQNFCGLSRCLDVQPISWNKVEVATPSHNALGESGQSKTDLYTFRKI
jgi:hypothetical protein